jgi:hypothetical protein
VSSSVSLNLWYEALGAQFGVVIQCDGHPDKVRQKLYALRSAHNDPDLESLAVVQSPTNPSQLWIIRRPEK